MELTIKETCLLTERTPFVCLALVKKTTQTTSKGSPMLRLEFSDRTGKFQAVVFDNTSLYTQCKEREFPGVVSVKGVMKHYNGSPSPDITALDDVPGEVSPQMIERFVERSSFNAEQLKKGITDLVESIQPEVLRNTVRHYLEQVGSNYYTSPAAKSVHQAYLFGLIEHTLWMCKLADKIIPLYGHVPLNRNVVISAILCHDAYKATEYTQGLKTETSIRGKLIGHVSDGYAHWLMSSHATFLDVATSTAVGHIILSHHGLLEWGAAVIPATPEAILVHQIDMMDSRMAAVYMAIKDIKDDPRKSVTDFSLASNSKIIVKIPNNPESVPL